MKRSPLKTRSTPPSRYLRILVVEGDATMREGLDVYFALLGHRAHLAADLASALQVASEEHFDALLCDLRLPDGDGCRLLRQLDQTGHRPPAVVSMSLSDGPEAAALSQAPVFRATWSSPSHPSSWKKPWLRPPAPCVDNNPPVSLHRSEICRDM